MTQDMEQQLHQMLSEVENSKDKLRLINNNLRLFYDRLEVIAKQHKRRQPVTDASFQEEFRAAVAELKTLSDSSQDFWHETRKMYNSSDKAKLIGDNRILVKQISIAALAFTRQTDELFTIFKNLQTLGKDVPLRLNWFILEYCCEDLFKITNRILFMTRDMEKHYE